MVAPANQAERESRKFENAAATLRDGARFGGVMGDCLCRRKRAPMARYGDLAHQVASTGGGRLHPVAKVGVNGRPPYPGRF